MTILVTGASGFVGTALVRHLRALGEDVRAAGRTAPCASPCASPGASPGAWPSAVAVGDIGPDTDWAPALAGVTSVVHLAALAHGRGLTADGALWRVNVEAVRALAAQAEAAGVRRMVFVSSVKAAGESSGAAPLTEQDVSRPSTDYGRAKRAAEEIVMGHTALSPVVVRPPLVIGPGAKANGASLLALCDSALALPFANARTRRSVMALDTLVAAIGATVREPLGPAGLYYVAERESVTLGELITHLRAGLDRAPGLFPAPQGLLPLPGGLRLPLEVDDRAFRAVYDFGESAQASAAHNLGEAARAWKAARGRNAAGPQAGAHA